MVTWPPHMGALLLTMRPGSRTIKFSGVHPQSTPRFTSTSSKAIIVATTPATSIENIPAPTYDPTATFDTITRILSSGRASQKTLNRIALDLITPAHRLTPGRLRLVHFLSPPASTIGGGIVNLGRVSSGEEFNLTKSMTEDLYWWAGTLTNARPRLAYPPVVAQPVCPNVIYSDASGNGGVGVVVDKTWFHWEWTKTPCENMVLGEAVAVEMAVSVLTTKYKVINVHIRLRCDNDTVIAGWKKPGDLSSTDSVFLRLLRVLHESNCWLELEKVPSAQNLADKPSRNEPPSGRYAKDTWSGEI